MNRRFKSKQFVLAVAVIFVLAFLVACGGDEDVTAPSTTTTTTAPATPAPAAPAPTIVAPTSDVSAKIDRLIFGVAFDGESNFSLRTHPGFSTFMALKPMYEWLVGIDHATGAFYPMLASEWAITGGDTLTYTIREGIQFHDGWGELTSDDVLATYEQQFHPLSEHFFFGAVERTVDRVEATDTQFIVRFKVPEAEVFWNFSENILGLEIISRAHFEAQGGQPPTLDEDAIAGTGAYSYLERKEGQYLRFERVPDHWRHTADFQEFEWRIINEMSTRLAALLTGEVHMASISPDLQVQTSKRGMKNVTSKVKGNRLFLKPLCCYYAEGGGFLNTIDEAPLQDLRVRKAMNKAIDRDALNEAFFNGLAELTYHPHLSEVNLGWNPEWKTRYAEEYGYDPVAARALLAEAGYGPDNPMKTTLNVSVGGLAGDNADLTEIIGGMWRDVGIDVEIHQADFAIDGPRQREFEIFNSVSLSEGATSPFIAESIITRHASPTANGYSTPEIDALGLAVHVLDPAAQEAAWRAWGDAIYDNHVVFSLFYDNPRITVNPEFVADWVWPGNVTATWSHTEYIEAAR